MLNKPKSYDDVTYDLAIAWKSCESNEKYQDDLKESISHLENLLDRYGIAHGEVTLNLGNLKIYDCSSYDTRKAWIYSDRLEKQNRKLEKVLFKLNNLLSEYGRCHPEIINDPGII